MRLGKKRRKEESCFLKRGAFVFKRCIMIFPDFENIEVINRIREKYDPLKGYVKPHITLVFPFESDISSAELHEHIKTTLCDCSPFKLTMQGFTVSVETQSNYLFLNVTEGLQSLYNLSRNLYTGILGKYQSEIYKEKYCPHLTVGNLSKELDYHAILNDLKNKKSKFTTIVNKVFVENIGNHESSIMEMVLSLSE